MLFTSTEQLPFTYLHRTEFPYRREGGHSQT